MKPETEDTANLFVNYMQEMVSLLNILNQSTIATRNFEEYIIFKQNLGSPTNTKNYNTHKK